ncbi:hypothetical protein PVAND_011394 [Polypedilum vanderplanki]|uniref:Microtubule-associated protein Jupiter n=1 Tax=Polypedilum vanderplanki TaxID=319348 RepID=A0A9J6CKA0_POLVA|nr:hypothetical protein PVAND_011394 [Polypedilum vanderplanki]
MSTNFQVGFISQKNSSKVLKPPGGGSSDIFAGDTASTPRSMKNHMKSNIFQAPSPVANSNNGEGRRPYVNSHNRLFGDNERSALTPAKNHMKSNIPLGNGNGICDEADSIKNHSNGGGSYDQISNENGFNGKNNGAVSDTSSKSVVLDNNVTILKNRVPPGGYASTLW